MITAQPLVSQGAVCFQPPGTFNEIARTSCIAVEIFKHRHVPGGWKRAAPCLHPHRLYTSFRPNENYGPLPTPS